jgi:ketosteroid isomerase-like protein
MLRSLMSCVLTIYLATGPALAQQTPLVSEREAREAGLQVAGKFEAAYNAGDAAAVARLFATKTTYFTPGGTVLSDHQAIEMAIAGRIKAGWTHELVKLGEAHPAGDAVWITGEYSLTGTGDNKGKQIGGHFCNVLIQEGGAWRIRMLLANLTPTEDVTGMAAAARSTIAK